MTPKHLIEEYEKELIYIELSIKNNGKLSNYGLLSKRQAQYKLIRRFIKDLKKLLV